MAREHRQHDGLVPIASEARPVQRHHHVLARTDDVRDPVRKVGVDLNAPIAQQPVHLLHPVLAQSALRVRKALTDRVDRERRTREHPQRPVRQRQHPLGVKVAVIKRRNKLNDLVLAKRPRCPHCSYFIRVEDER